MNFTLVSRMGTWETKKRHAIAFPSSNFINTFCCAGQTVLIHAYKLQPPFLKICRLMNFVATSNGHKEHKKRNGNSKDKLAYVTSWSALRRPLRQMHFDKKPVVQLGWRFPAWR